MLPMALLLRQGARSGALAGSVAAVLGGRVAWAAAGSQAQWASLEAQAQLQAMALASRSVSTSVALPMAKKSSSTGEQLAPRPKPGPNPYACYAREQYHEVRSSLPTQPDGKPAHSSEVFKELGRRWQTLSEHEKAKYVGVAEGDAATKAHKAWKKVATAKSTNGWVLFVKEALPQYLAKLPVGDSKEDAQNRGREAMKLTAQGWRALPEDQKAIFNNKAKDIREAVKQ